MLSSEQQVTSKCDWRVHDDCPSIGMRLAPVSHGVSIKKTALVRGNGDRQTISGILQREMHTTGECNLCIDAGRHAPKRVKTLWRRCPVVLPYFVFPAQVTFCDRHGPLMHLYCGRLCAFLASNIPISHAHHHFKCRSSTSQLRLVCMYWVMQTCVFN